jgi:hypothetical protein
MTMFFDPLRGERVAMNFDFGRSMSLRHAADTLATPIPHVGDDWTSATSGDNAPEPLLPEGVTDHSSGRYFANCCRCERECDVTEFMDEAADIDFTQWFGGCGPRCCP